MWAYELGIGSESFTSANHLITLSRSSARDSRTTKSITKVPQVIELSHWHMASSRPGQIVRSPAVTPPSWRVAAPAGGRHGPSPYQWPALCRRQADPRGADDLHGRVVRGSVARPTLAQFADCEVNAASMRDARLVSTTSAHRPRNRATYWSCNCRSGTRRLGADGPPCGTIKTRLAVGLSRWVMARNSAPPVSSIAARPQTIATG
jgi:hypothetical protein